MCKFHKDVAQKVAIDPATGQSHIGHETIIRIALSRYWIERYIEGADNVTGYSAYPMATTRQQAAFARSGLKKSLAEIGCEEEEGVALLRRKLDALEQTQDLSPKALKLPMATAREAFTEMAIEEFYTGDPRDDFHLVDSMGDERLKPLYEAVAAFQNDPDIEPVLARLIQGKICTLYTNAPGQVNMTMVAAYERLPERVQNVGASLSRYGGNIVLGGFSGLVGHGIHYASVFGAGLMAGTASSFNLALSAAFLLASYGGWNQFFGGRFMNLKQQVSALAVQAGLTAVVVIGAQAVLPHHNHFDTERARWFASLPENYQQDILQSGQNIINRLPKDLQRKLDIEAEKDGIDAALFLQTCDGTNPVTLEINTYLVAQNAAERPVTLTLVP